MYVVTYRLNVNFAKDSSRQGTIFSLYLAVPIIVNSHEKSNVLLLYRIIRERQH